MTSSLPRSNGKNGTASSQTSGYQKGDGEPGIHDESRIGTSGGGGGGYFGGLTIVGPTAGQAGGGSSYIDGVISYGSVEKNAINGETTMPVINGFSVGNSGHGFARITLLSSFINNKKCVSCIQNSYFSSDKNILFYILLISFS